MQYIRADASDIPCKTVSHLYEGGSRPEHHAGLKSVRVDGRGADGGAARLLMTVENLRIELCRLGGSRRLHVGDRLVTHHVQFGWRSHGRFYVQGNYRKLGRLVHHRVESSEEDMIALQYRRR